MIHFERLIKLLQLQPGTCLMKAKKTLMVLEGRQCVQPTKKY